MVSASTNPMGFFVTPNHGIYRLVVYYRSTDAMPSPAPASVNIVSQHLPFYPLKPFTPDPSPTHPPFPQKWNETNDRLTNKSNESRDNTRFMESLEPYYRPLYTLNPEQLAPHIPLLINRIRMINNISSYFNSGHHISNIFIKVIVLIT